MDDNFIGPKDFDQIQSVSMINDKPEEGVVENANPLSLDIDDDELIKVIDLRIEASKKFYEEKKNLPERRKKMVKYLFGRQIDDKEKREELKKYETRYLDNALYEIEGSLKPLAMSHLPDMIVLPGTEDPEKVKTAKDLSIVVNDTNKQREQRRVLAMGFKHLPAYLTGIIKAVWRADKGKYGDFEFINVHPNLVTVSHTAKLNDANKMDFIAETLPISVQELFMRFPNKIEQLKEELVKDGVQLKDKENWKDLATEVNITEIWFTWYKRKKEPGEKQPEDLSIFEPGVKWEKIEGVMWKYKTVLLEKMLNPNFDYEGEQAFFTTDPEGNKVEMKQEDMLMAMLSGNYQNIQTETVYHNYFDKPQKPYFFFGYEQWGEMPYDETSRIEQNIRNQENLDDQGKRMMDQLKQRVKHIWSKESGLKSSDIQKMDMENPMIDALVEGDLTKVHTTVNPERPDAAQFKSVQDSRDRMYAIAHASAIRGEIQSDVATSNQIGREADFTAADDLVEETINSAAEWMSQWQMQFIKLRYTEEHMKQILGPKGSTTFIKLRRDMISDGMEVTIKASSTDKLRAQKNALDMANAKLIDPLTFYEDMDMSDPEGRTEKLMLFSTSPAEYIAKYVLKLKNTQAMATALNNQSTTQVAGQQNPAPVNNQPQNPTVTNTSAVPTAPALNVTASPTNGIL